MTSTFSVKRLVAGRAVVEGTDVFGTQGQTVVTTTEWDDVKAQDNVSLATESFDQAVKEFFAPIVEAAEKAKAAVKTPAEDPISYYVIEDPVEGQPSTPGTVLKLGRDSIILRMVEQGDTDRLVWVDGGLEILEA